MERQPQTRTKAKMTDAQLEAAGRASNQQKRV